MNLMKMERKRFVFFLFQVLHSYNFLFQKMNLDEYGVITDGGKKIYMKGMGGQYTMDKITEEQLEELENDFDDIEAPPGPYKVQPENQGRILWFSGAPGMGKSTTAQFLARDHGYVYYEADAFAMVKNPFNDLQTDNPSMHQAVQRNLKGPGDKERLTIAKKAQEIWGPLMAGQEYDKQLMRDYYTEMVKDIIKQKKRIGGDWAIAHVVWNKEIRDIMRYIMIISKNLYLFLTINREMLGPELTFVHLTMGFEDKRKRLMKRHEGGETFVEIMEVIKLT